MSWALPLLVCVSWLAIAGLVGSGVHAYRTCDDVGPSTLPEMVFAVSLILAGTALGGWTILGTAYWGALG